METTLETPVEKKRRKLAEQDQRVAIGISQAAKIITTARDSAEAQALLEPRGYDEAALDEAFYAAGAGAGRV